MQAQSPDKNIKAMVVDDAAFMRKALVEILSGSGDIEVVGVAKHGKEALDAIKTLRPDVITLDVDMPIMDGLTTIKHIMIKNPLPVVMVSGLADQGRITFEALSLGAVDFFPKPSGTVSDDIHDSGAELVRTLRVAAGINPRAIKRAVKRHGQRAHPKEGKRLPPSGLLVVVALQGAVSSFIRLASAVFPLRSTACVCIQDMSSAVLNAYARELDAITGCAMPFEAGQLLYAGCCTLVQKKRLPNVAKQPRGNVSLECNQGFTDLRGFLDKASDVFGEDLNVCILGGQQDEELDGLHKVREKGGTVSALVPEKCASGGLAKMAIEMEMARPFDSEQALWNGIKAFSRQVALRRQART